MTIVDNNASVGLFDTHVAIAVSAAVWKAACETSGVDAICPLQSAIWTDDDGVA